MARAPRKSRRRAEVDDDGPNDADMTEGEPDPLAETPAQRAWNTGYEDAPTGRQGRRPRESRRAARMPRPSTDLVSVLNGLVGRGVEVLELSRYNEVNGVAYYVTDVSVSTFSLKWVKQFLGGGRFKLAAWGTADDGTRGLIMPPVDFAVEGMPRSFVDPATGQSVGSPVGNGQLSPQDMQATAMGALVTALTAGLAGMAKSMLAMGDGGNKKDDLERIVILKQILDDGKSSGKSLGEQIALYREFREAAAEFAPKDTGNPFLDALKEGVEGVKPVMASIARKIDAAPNVASTPRAVAAGRAPEVAVSAPSQPEQQEVREVQSIDDYLGELVGYLLDKARRGVNPERVAIRVVEEIEEDHPLWHKGLQAQAESNATFVDDLLARLRAHPDMQHADADTLKWVRETLEFAKTELTRAPDDEDEGDEDEPVTEEVST